MAKGFDLPEGDQSPLCICNILFRASKKPRLYARPDKIPSISFRGTIFLVFRSTVSISLRLYGIF